MSRRTQFLLTGAAAAAAVALAGGVAVAQSRDDVTAAVAQAEADAARAEVQADDAVRQAREAGLQARHEAAQARVQAHAARAEARRIVDENGVRIERDGDMTIIRTGGHDDAGRAQHLRNILQLRPNQEAALGAYLAAMKPRETGLHMERLDDARKTTPERLAQMEQRINARAAAEKSRLDAIRRFYGQLDAAQRKAFDELPPMELGREVRIFRTNFAHPPIPPIPPVPPVAPVPPVPPVPPSL